MSVGSRIKELRKAQKSPITQQEFADRVGIKQSTVATYEADRNVPSDAVISLICREFHVREAWLRDGEGEMFEQRTRRDDIAFYLGKVSSGKASELEELIIDLMAETTADEWLALAAKLRRITERKKKENGD